MNPVPLREQLIPRFYAGGARIAAFRGIEGADDHAPEDWVGSTVAVFGDDRLGLSSLPDGRLLRDAIADEPEAFLGPDHVRRFGADPGLLVKLLDAGERLPVHCHPDRGFSRRHLDCPYGKTEAWVVVAAEPGAVVHLGFTRDVAAGELAGWVHAQDAAALLEAMHRVPVGVGDAVLVPAGIPHAIGEGLLVVELQEPTDLSVLLEWDGFAVDGTAEGHLGLGFDRALECVDRSGWGRDALAALWGDRRGTADPVRRLLPAEADPFFRAERVSVAPGTTVELDAGFSVVVVLDGSARLGPVEVRRGDTALVPHAAGPLTVTGRAELVRCRPPAAEDVDAAGGTA